MVAAAASWMEATKLPLRELRKRYTRSELAIMAWRSSEIAANMEDNMATVRKQQTQTADVVQQGAEAVVINAVRERELAIIEDKIGGFIWKAVDEKTGDIDLRKLTGTEAAIYMEAMGITPPGTGAIAMLHGR